MFQVSRSIYSFCCRVYYVLTLAVLAIYREASWHAQIAELDTLTSFCAPPPLFAPKPRKSLEIIVVFVDTKGPTDKERENDRKKGKREKKKN